MRRHPGRGPKKAPNRSAVSEQEFGDKLKGLKSFTPFKLSSNFFRFRTPAGDQCLNILLRWASFAFGVLCLTLADARAAPLRSPELPLAVDRAAP